MSIQASGLRPVVVIGSGIGGATLSAQLVEAGIRPLLIEWGTDSRSPPSADPAMAPALESMGIPSARALELGGTSALWSGVLGRYRAPAGAQESAQWRAWVDALAPWYERAEQTFGVGAEQRSRAGEHLRRLGAQWSGSSELDLYLVPDRAPRLREMLRSLVATDRLELWLGHRVEALTDLGDRIRIECQVSGESRVLFARHVVCCAGTIGSAEIMVNSRRVDGSPLVRGLSEHCRVVDHPMGFVAKIGARPEALEQLLEARSVGAGFSARYALPVTDPLDGTECGHAFGVYSPIGQADARADRVLYQCLDMRGPRRRLENYARLIGSPRALARAYSARFAPSRARRYLDLFLLADQRDEEAGHIEWVPCDGAFGPRLEARLRWRLGSAQRSRLARGLCALYDAIDARYAVQWRQRADAAALERALVSGAHLLGSLRSGASEDAPVTPDLSLRESALISVCDASVLPFSGHANPSLTIAALAHRLACRLRVDLSPVSTRVAQC